MKISNVIALLMLVFLKPTISLASWVQLSDEKLLEQTNVGVIGEFIGTTRITLKESDKTLIVGIIKVESVLKGTVEKERVLVVIRNANTPLVSSVITFKKGQKGLWLLKKHASTNLLLYSANHPQQFIAAGDITKINHFKSLLLENKTR